LYSGTLKATIGAKKCFHAARTAENLFILKTLIYGIAANYMRGRKNMKEGQRNNMYNAKMARDILEAVRANWHYMTDEELISIYKILQEAQKRVKTEMREAKNNA